MLFIAKQLHFEYNPKMKKLIADKLREFGADIVLFSVALSWGATFVIVQDAIKDIPVFAFLFLRFFLSFLLMFALSLKYIKQFDKQLLKAGVFLGSLFFLGYATQTYGLVYTKSSIVAFITGLNVIIVPIVVYIFFRQKVYIFSIIGAIIAAFGLWLLTGAGGLNSFGKGEFYSFLCAAFFAVHIVFTAKLSREYNIFLLVSIELLSVAMLSLIASLSVDPFTFPKTFTYPIILALVTTVLFATVYALFMQTYMQQFTTPAKTAIIFTMEPASAAVFSYFYAHEVLNYTQITGGAIMIAAMLIAEIGSYYRNRN